MSHNPVFFHLNYPSPDFRITKSEDQQWIWDHIRKKKVILTPEEWVRQNFIRYLTNVLKYPSSLFAIEKKVRQATRYKRCDIIVYRESLPWMIVECKEPRVALNEKVLEQILNYNLFLKVPFLILTNGPETCGIKSKQTSWSYLKELPSWK